MTLRECYTDRSYYYLKLEREMSRIIEQKGSNGLGAEFIQTFCSKIHGDHQLDSGEDYKSILTGFRCFVSGAVWALKHPSANDWVKLLANTATLVPNET